MRQRFSQQFKEQAIAHVFEHPKEPLNRVAESFGVGYSTLDNWVRQHKREMGLDADAVVSADRKRVLELEREVRHLREVNDIFKKAHVYFVNHPSAPSTRS